jgi:hypothetical protein
MGLGPLFLRDLMALKRLGALDGCRRVVEIGAQQINDDLITAPQLPEFLSALGAPHGLRLKPVGAENFAELAPPGHLLWSALGWHSQSVDIDGGSIDIDLNRGRVPWRYRGAFDMAVNAGTTEHVANQGNAFAVIHGLVRTGGIMYHELPAYGHVDHGFFGYQPKFFWRLCAANEYEMLYFRLEGVHSDRPPDYAYELNAKFGADPPPAEISRLSLRVCLRKVSPRKFMMPMDR